MSVKPNHEQDRLFIVGHGPGGFTMLGMAGSFSGQGMTGSDRRQYDCITSAEPFDSSRPDHQEFIPFRDLALWRMARDAARIRRAGGR